MIFESKRSESDIVYDILSETRKGLKKTQLMYNANMSNTQLNRYLDVLLEKQIISEQQTSDGRRYWLTDTGEEVLDHLEKVICLLNGTE